MSDAPHRLLRAGAILMALGVAAGAVGAHGRAGRVGPDLLATWRTGALYHLLHGLALVALGASGRPFKLAGGLMIFGILVFSGSLYALVLTGARWLGAITPVGGLALIAGWVSAAIGR